MLRRALVTGLRASSLNLKTAATGAAFMSTGVFVLPELPFDKTAFGKELSSEQITVHWDKHHRNYVNQLNTHVADKPDVKALSLEQVVVEAAKRQDKFMFNNAAQIFNHNVFWQSLTPKGGEAQLSSGKCPKLVELMKRDLGGVDKALELFKKEAKTHFASGWAWFVITKDGKLAVKSYHDADSPIVHGDKPLLTIDVWEHAYYIDYQNRRADFVDTFVKKFANFEAAEKRL